MNIQDRFTEVIKENEGIIFKISTFYTNNEDDQKDLYQEIVMQLWKSFEQFRGESKISTWLYRVALNTAISLFKKEKRRGDKVPIDLAILKYTDSRDEIFEERIKLLYDHISRLNELEKGLMLLCLEENSYDEIASITGLTVSNVGTRISRIKQKLKTQIANSK